MPQDFTLQPLPNNAWKLSFFAMASPCEVLLEGQDGIVANQLSHAIVAETRRIEHKFSRYRKDSALSDINQHSGQWRKIDEETLRLLQFADQCYQLSDGMFDVTSGILRKVWQFDGSDKVPPDSKVAPLLQHIGWSRVEVMSDAVRLPSGMELDLGGIGKEYAVDRIVQLIKQHNGGVALVNFGGDLATTGSRLNGQNWRVGIELKGLPKSPTKVIEFQHGAIATSGDANRYLVKDGVRYSHILNPKTGMALSDAASSITVAANTCIEAGIVATIAMLSGQNAESFLQDSGYQHWLFRR